jgi:hypothetical protein
MVLEPIGQVRLAIGRLERRERRRVAALLQRPRRQVGDRLELGPGELAPDHQPELLPHLCQHLPQPCAGAHDRRHGVVELVGEASGHRAEGHEPFVLLDDRAGVGALGRGALEQMGRHGEPLPHRLAEVAGGDLEQAAVGDRPGRAQVHLGHAAVGDVGVEGAGVGAVVVGAEQLELAALHPLGHDERAGEEHEEARGGGALGVDGGAARVLDDPAALGQPAELVVVQGLEQEQGAQLLGLQPLGPTHDKTSTRP